MNCLKKQLQEEEELHVFEQRGGRSEPPMECLVFLDIETVTAGDLRCNLFFSPLLRDGSSAI